MVVSSGGGGFISGCSWIPFRGTCPPPGRGAGTGDPQRIPEGELAARCPLCPSPGPGRAPDGPWTKKSAGGGIVVSLSIIAWIN